MSKTIKHLVSVSFGMEDYNYDKIVEFGGEKFRITQYSTNFNLDSTLALIKKYDGNCDAFCISGIPSQITYGKNKYFTHPQSSKVKASAFETPIFDGQALKDIYIPYVLRKDIVARSNFYQGQSFALYSGALSRREAEVLSESGVSFTLADMYFFLKIPKLLKSLSSLNLLIGSLVPFMKKKTLRRSRLSLFSTNTPNMSEFFNNDVFVGTEASFNYIDLTHLKGKSVVLDMVTPQITRKFQAAGVADVSSLLDPSIGLDGLNFSIIEALIYLQSKQSELREKDILSWIESQNTKVHAIELSPKSVDDKSRFAFIIHPLSGEYLLKHPLLRKLPRSKFMTKMAEDAFSYMPGFYYGSIKNITSKKNGKTVEGLVYAVTETPKKLMQKNPESVYKKLVSLSYDAKNHGASIIGLGAYTKIVGDAGVTVNNRSPIPVTTGNSLSACSTLWAAKYAIDKLGFVPKEDGRYQGRAMVVGATGSIGAVSAKVLCKNWKEIILVAPRAHKLLELKEEILKLFPAMEIRIGTNPDEFSHETDLIITTTSGQGEKILDISQVKAGAVICDVSRPFDISKEEALTRPDVMVVASGEVLLPGEVEMKIDIGLEGDMVYACLAETALLALEGRYESFTLSRRIDYNKVIEIDRMAREHGVRLATIMGHNGVLTDEEFDLCREHALVKRESTCD
ncbi:hypothetical protein M899_1806 [Bacteriovorax sp. BSW11_IV]|uniref:hypothetical protein n=1 Tax=Bacteriovorax sp. BSW11_IV TaxID=1353529 RepID=UPI000389EE7D|nr:hypothetical protein [Bacteriovorax sp. BSW11_IV]EQC43642.1 hypothetical protein M899_1806 [Bacteriovorax sp. BSW11_IV]